jgi:predicted DNA-binding transcriptional regulator AlpA
MVIQLLVNVEAPDIRPGLNGELQHDLKALAVDWLERGLKRHTEFPIKAEVIEMPSGLTLSAPLTSSSEVVLQILANKPLLTKADVCLRLNVTERTIERHVADGSLPKPMHIHGPRWRAEDIAAYETEKSVPDRPHRD